MLRPAVSLVPLALAGCSLFLTAPAPPAEGEGEGDVGEGEGEGDIGEGEGDGEEGEGDGGEGEGEGEGDGAEGEGDACGNGHVDPGEECDDGNDDDDDCDADCHATVVCTCDFTFVVDGRGVAEDVDGAPALFPLPVRSTGPDVGPGGVMSRATLRGAESTPTGSWVNVDVVAGAVTTVCASSCAPPTGDAGPFADFDFVLHCDEELPESIGGRPLPSGVLSGDRSPAGASCSGSGVFADAGDVGVGDALTVVVMSDVVFGADDNAFFSRLDGTAPLETATLRGTDLFFDDGADGVLWPGPGAQRDRLWHAFSFSADADGSGATIDAVPAGAAATTLGGLRGGDALFVGGRAGGDAVSDASTPFDELWIGHTRRSDAWQRAVHLGLHGALLSPAAPTPWTCDSDEPELCVPGERSFVSAGATAVADVGAADPGDRFAVSFALDDSAGDVAIGVVELPAGYDRAVLEQLLNGAPQAGAALWAVVVGSAGAGARLLQVGSDTSDEALPFRTADAAGSLWLHLQVDGEAVRVMTSLVDVKAGGLAPPFRPVVRDPGSERFLFVRPDRGTLLVAPALYLASP